MIECEICGHTVKTRSAMWKHKKSKHPDEDEITGEEVEVNPAPSDDDVDSDPTPPPTPEEPVWASFDLGLDETTTHTAPSVLKVAAKQSKEGRKKKMTKAEEKAHDNLNVELLKGMLTVGDGLMSKYGAAVTLDPEYLVKHDNATKTMTAEAQYRYLKSKGLDPSKVINEGVIAGALTAHYFGKPIMEIRKQSKVPLLKGAGKRLGFMRKIPVLGRLFGRRKKSKVPEEPIAIEVTE